MKRIFLEKYFPASREENIRKKIYGIKQYTGESLHENMLDAASGEVSVDKTPVQARNLIENMAANSQQFGTNRSDPATKRGNEVNVSSLEQKLIELTNFVHQMAVRNGQTVRACGVCAKVVHATDMCPTLQEVSAEQVNAAGGFLGPPQQKYYPYSTHTIQIGRIIPISDTETLYYTNHSSSLYATVSSTDTASSSSNAWKLEQTVVNPKENVSAITLRSGKELKVNEEVVKEPVQNKDEKGSKVEEDKTVQMDAPKALKESRKDEGIKGLYEVFRRCDVNIPLLDAIKQRKQKLKGCQKVELGEQVSAVIQRNVPTKCKDPDVNNGTLTMEFDREVVKFHIFDTLQIPDCESVVSNLDVINHLSQEQKKAVNEDKVKKVIARPIENFTAESFHSDLQIPRKSKQKKQRPKNTEKLRNWVKVVRKTRYEPP
ncbi:uncharacterized protein [Henckelia pumila]|uniref:uncharacterized protein n=1 Tax=Henckelia pumila TaxID=405737 RepID=UPI003C6E68F9